MSEIILPYGREKLTVKIPDGIAFEILAGQPMKPLPSPRQVLRERSADPFGRPPLKVMAQKVSSATVIVSDYTRNILYPQWICELFNLLNAAGIPDSRINMYIASGTHRPLTEDELRETYGAEAISRINVQQHDSDAEGRMKKIGRTDRGTVVMVDERVADAEMLIVTGGIQYHYFAGYSGGRKGVIPGCAGRSTVMENHSLAVDPNTGDFFPSVKPGVLVTNPVHEDMEQGVSALKPDLCVNVILNSDKQIAWMDVGDVAYVLREGAKFLDSHNKLAVKDPADMFVLSSGGHPKDLTLFQAHKSLRHSLGALKPGAKVLWLAKCEQGEGVEEFCKFRSRTLSECQSRIQSSVSLYSLCSLSIKQVTQMHEVHLVSNLPAEHVREWGMVPHSDVYEALASIVPGLPEGAKWLIAPDMSNQLPVYEAAEDAMDSAEGQEGRK